MYKDKIVAEKWLFFSSKTISDISPMILIFWNGHKSYISYVIVLKYRCCLYLTEEVTKKSCRILSYETKPHLSIALVHPTTFFNGHGLSFSYSIVYEYTIFYSVVSVTQTSAWALLISALKFREHLSPTPGSLI